MPMTSELFEQFQKNVRPGPAFDNGTRVPELPNEPPARLIAFYLPQFHAIPENDRAWGSGFTEWTNVTKALPWFPEHYQPRLPGALGFYDLRYPDALKAQAELARKYGIHGFCFHFYWFAGRQLLERPLQNLLNDKSIDLPFCLNWANENWTRRWDGREADIIVAQKHSPEDDLAFAATVRPMFDDPRYIRVAGRPLLLLYRPRLLPNVAETIDRWREFFAGGGEQPMFLMVQGFGDFDPNEFGLDGAVGFPPWGLPTSLDAVPVAKVFHPSFRGDVRAYEQLANQASSYWPTSFRYYPGVCPSWDNSARRRVQPGIIHGSTPKLYGAWLEATARKVCEKNLPEHRLVFINAWNEWAEGTYLEPDQHYGNAYLSETAAVLVRITTTPKGDLIHSLPGSPPPDRFGLARRASRKLASELSRAATFLSSW